MPKTTTAADPRSATIAPPRPLRDLPQATIVQRFNQHSAAYSHSTDPAISKHLALASAAMFVELLRRTDLAAAPGPKVSKYRGNAQEVVARAYDAPGKQRASVLEFAVATGLPVHTAVKLRTAGRGCLDVIFDATRATAQSV